MTSIDAFRSTTLSSPEHRCFHSMVVPIAPMSTRVTIDDVSRHRPATTSMRSSTPLCAPRSTMVSALIHYRLHTEPHRVALERPE